MDVSTGGFYYIAPMKKIPILLFCIALTKLSFAQKDSLAFDEHGKYIYYKIVNVDKYTADTLYKKSLQFLKNAYDKKTLKLTSEDAKNTAITGEGFFVFNKKQSLAKHPDGQISYQLKLEIRDHKYRYWLTNFVYKPYYRDRYNNYVPDNGIDIPLEKSSKKLSEKDLNNYLDECAMFSRQLGDGLKKSILAGPASKKEAPKKVISINKW